MKSKDLRFVIGFILYTCIAGFVFNYLLKICSYIEAINFNYYLCVIMLVLSITSINLLKKKKKENEDDVLSKIHQYSFKCFYVVIFLLIGLVVVMLLYEFDTAISIFVVVYYIAYFLMCNLFVASYYNDVCISNESLNENEDNNIKEKNNFYYFIQLFFFFFPFPICYIYTTFDVRHNSIFGYLSNIGYVVVWLFIAVVMCSSLLISDAVKNLKIKNIVIILGYVISAVISFTFALDAPTSNTILILIYIFFGYLTIKKNNEIYKEDNLAKEEQLTDRNQ